jgi:large subunit ribosomal protein L21
MYAIIECGGKQYRVQEGDLIRVEKLEAEVGSNLIIDRVLLVGGEKTAIGTPFVAGATVACKVLNHDKNKKILVFHYKAKKNVRTRYGHRQPFTSLLVEGIFQKGQAAAKTVKAEA